MKRAVWLVAACFVASCGPTVRGGNGPPGGGGNGQCPANCQNCDEKRQCHDCVPGGNACSGGNVVRCTAEGTLGEILKMCDPQKGEMCAAGDCFSACAAAASTHSYIGCDYWPVTLLNTEVNPYFDFAVAVANPITVGDVVQGAAAQVTITRGNQTLKQVAVAPGEVETILLPWVEELSHVAPEKSALVEDGAYHLVSSIPVTVYQFNPLQFEKKATSSCQDPLSWGPTCHSFSNDASILLPSTALKNEYLVISRTNFVVNSIMHPGFFAVVATGEGTTKVTVKSSAYTESGVGVAALNPDQTKMFSLSKGQVLQVVSKHVMSPCVATSSGDGYTYCDMGPKYDLTGTRVSADQPVAVFSGHACSFVPYNKWACDHLEEQMTPLDTWGQKILVAQTKPQTNGEPNVWRIVSGSDGNAITFDPNVHGPVTLAAGQFVEFSAQGGFLVAGTGRIAVGQFMVGNLAVNKNLTVGDPSLGLGVPIEQYRSSYDFLSPATYTANFVTITRPMNSGTLVLDGQQVDGSPTNIGSSGFGYQYVSLKPGAHHLTGTSPFGITISGIASFTSYLYVGGQNLNDVPIQ